jgi:hypothetical protein
MNYRLKVNMEVQKLDLPVYKTGMNLSLWKRQMDEYDTMWNRERYRLLLMFINSWLANYNISIKSLLDFKKISEEDVSKDEKYNKKIVKDNINIINKIFSMNHKIKGCYVKKEIDEEYINSGKNLWDDESDDEISIDTDDINELEIIKIIREMVKKIDYTLVKNVINDKNYYTIKGQSTSIKTYIN